MSVSQSGSKSAFESSVNAAGAEVDSGLGTAHRVADAAAWKLSETATRVGAAAKDARAHIADAALSLAGEATQSVRGVVDEQIRESAEYVAAIAGSVRAVADELDPTAPRLARFARDGAERIEALSDTLRYQTPDEMLDTAAAYTRRNPALVFGAAAVCGFFLVRALTVGPQRDDAIGDVERSRFAPPVHERYGDDDAAARGPG